MRVELFNLLYCSLSMKRVNYSLELIFWNIDTGLILRSVRLAKIASCSSFYISHCVALRVAYFGTIVQKKIGLDGNVYE